MTHKKGISVFYLQFVIACIGIVCGVSFYLYVQANEIQEKIPIYFPSNEVFENDKDINNTIYVPEFRIIPGVSIYDIVFHFNTPVMIKKVLRELLLGSHSLYTRQIVPQGVFVHSVFIGTQNKNNKYKIFIQLEGTRANITKYDFDRIEHWLTYNMNIYFPLYDVQLI